MNRQIRRALARDDKELTKIVKKVLKQKLQQNNVKFVEVDNGATIYSDEQDRVEVFYNLAMFEVWNMYSKLGCNIKKLRQYYQKLS